MFGRGFRIATIRGVPVNVNSSWIWIAVLLVATFWARFDQGFPTSRRERHAFAVFGALIFFGSVFLHESAHAISARLAGIEVHGIRSCSSVGSPRPERTRRVRTRVRDRGPRTGDEPLAGAVLRALPVDRDLVEPAARAVQYDRRREPVHGGVQRAAGAAARRRPDARGGDLALPRGTGRGRRRWRLAPGSSSPSSRACRRGRRGNRDQLLPRCGSGSSACSSRGARASSSGSASTRGSPRRRSRRWTRRPGGPANMTLSQTLDRFLRGHEGEAFCP